MHHHLIYSSFPCASYKPVAKFKASLYIGLILARILPRLWCVLPIAYYQQAKFIFFYNVKINCCGEPGPCIIKFLILTFSLMNQWKYTQSMAPSHLIQNTCKELKEKEKKNRMKKKQNNEGEKKK